MGAVASRVKSFQPPSRRVYASRRLFSLISRSFFPADEEISRPLPAVFPQRLRRTSSSTPAKPERAMLPGSGTSSNVKLSTVPVKVPPLTPPLRVM